MDSSQESTQEPCHFLALPPELRTRIYERIFTIHEDPKECVTNIQGIWLNNADPKPTVLSILATCRQINSEAAGMFYDLNHLYVHSDLLRRTKLKLPSIDNSRIFRRGFIETLSAKRLAGITTLSVQVHGDLDEVSGACARIAAGRLPRLRVILFTFKPRFCGSVHRDMPREHWWLLRSFRKLPMLTNICFIEVTIPGANGVIGLEGRETLVRLAGELSATWMKKSGGEKVVQWKFLEEEE